MGRTCGVITKDGSPCDNVVAGQRKYCPKHRGGRSKHRPPSLRTCGTLTKDGSPCDNVVAGQRIHCPKHPGGRSTYRQPSPVAKTTTAGKQRPEGSKSAGAGAAEGRRRSRIDRRATKAAETVTDSWARQILGRLDSVVAPGTSASLSLSDCAELARAADLILRGQRPRRRAAGWGFVREIMGGPTGAESLAETVSTRLGLPPDDADIAAARALQSVGIALCQEAGQPLTRCPCFNGPAGTELEKVLFLVLRLAVGDWSALALPLELLASP
jgi:hypothetical protein